MQTTDTTPTVSLCLYDYATARAVTHVVPVAYPKTDEALQVMVGFIESQINDLWHYGDRPDHRIREVRERVASIIGQTRLITRVTGDYPHDERIVYALRKACFDAENRALARLRK